MSDDVGSLLLRAGMIAPQQLEDARNIAKKIGGTVPEELVLSGALDDEELTRFYCRQLLIPRVNPSQLAKLSPRLLEKLPADMAREFRSIPTMLDTDGNLTVVMSDPSDIKVADEIGFFTGSYIVRAIATQAQIAWCLAHYFDHITPLHKKLVAKGEWPKDKVKPPTVPPEKASQDSEQIATGPLAREQREAKLGTARRRNKRRAGMKRPTNQQPSPPELVARTGEINTNPGSRSRKLSMQPAVVIAEEPPSVVIAEEPPSVVISMEAEVSNAIPQAIEKGTDTSPFLLSRDLPKAVESEATPILLSNESAKASDLDSAPIVLGAKGKTIRRAARNTFAGVGSLGNDSPTGPWEEALAQHSASSSRVPYRDTIQMEPIEEFDLPPNESDKDDNDREGEKTNPEKFVVKIPLEDSGPEISISADDMASDDDWGLPGDTPPPTAEISESADTSNSVPSAVDNNATIKMTSFPAHFEFFGEKEDTSLDDLPGAAVLDEEDDDAEEPNETGSVAQAAAVELSAGIASKVLGSLRTIDRSSDKGEVIETLLDFLDLAFERCGFLALRNQELSPWRLHGCSAGATTKIDVSGDSTLGEVVRMRLPYTGTIDDHSAKQLAGDLNFPEARNFLAIPITVKGRVLGVLFGLSRNQRLYEEHVAVLAEAASEAFERIILAKRS